MTGYKRLMLSVAYIRLFVLYCFSVKLFGLGTVNKLTEQIAKNAFPDAKKKRRQCGHCRGFLMQQPGKQASKLFKLINDSSLLCPQNLPH